MTYAIYHIPGKKIGVTNNIKNRVEEQQGYNEGEYIILEMSDDIEYISKRELELQQQHGYRVDRQLYSELFNNNYIKLKTMNINVTEMTTTFPCPANKLKGQLMDNIGMTWRLEGTTVMVTETSIKWIMKNVKSSQYTADRCYIYNKAFVRFFDNNDVYPRTGGLPHDCGPSERICENGKASRFDLIRAWANERGLYDGGDTKTQTLKLVEEAGEICRAVLKNDHAEVVDGIGDCVVVLTNLAELQGTTIEKCIDIAYNEIKDRTGKMNNGTFKKD